MRASLELLCGCWRQNRMSMDQLQRVAEQELGRQSLWVLEESFEVLPT